MLCRTYRILSKRPDVRFMRHLVLNMLSHSTFVLNFSISTVKVIMNALYHDQEAYSLCDQTSIKYQQEFDSDENEESILDQEKKRLEEQGKMAALQVNQAQESLEEKYHYYF